MRRFSLVLIFLVLTLNLSHSQESREIDAYWELLFNNQRDETLAKFQNGQKNGIEDFLTNEILKNENGRFKIPKGFIKDLQKFPEFEYYLYALWNQSFFFDTYLNSGFNKKNMQNINGIDLANIKNPTVHEAARYLKSVVARHTNDWEKFYEINGNIPSIRKWQFCGSFENLNGSGLNTPYEPEIKAISKKDFNANSNGYLNWYSDEGREKEAYQFYSSHAEYGGGVNYAQVFVDNPQERRMVLRLGSSNLAKVWVNDVLVLENNNKGITDLDAYGSEITLPKGTSRILVKSADADGIAYFMVRLTDALGNAIDGLTYDNNYKPYVDSTKNEINPQDIQHPVEAFFLNGLKKDESNFFLTYCLVQTYLRNSRYNEAKDIVLPLIEKYPTSSFLKKTMIQIYSKENDYTSVNELKANIKKDDETYYLSLVYRLTDTQELFKLPIADFEKFMDDFTAATDIEIMRHSSSILSNIRKEDKNAIKKELDVITSDFDDQLKVVKIYLPLYSNYLNEEAKAIEVLEKMNKDYFDYGALRNLASLYDKQDRKDKVLELFAEKYELLKSDNFFLKDYIEYLHSYKNYDDALPIIDQALKNYPYSFIAMEYKGMALEQTGKKKEALTYYNQALKHNGTNTSLRKKVEDLSNYKDYFEVLETKNIYEYIASNRNKDIKSNYGYTYLLEEALIQLYSEGGGRTQKKYVIEITSDSGIENLKEVNLGLSGGYLITKSEIIKPNTKTVPASRSGSNLVFNNLEIGDVIYIDYDTNYSNGGRFYKDHVEYFKFDSYHPVVKNKVKILVPEGKKISHKLINGEVDYKKQVLGGYVSHEWEASGRAVLPPQEDYMPSLGDLSAYLHFSTIDSWTDISNWYSDLVRPQIVINSDVREAYDTIFPEGIANLSEDERSKRIYYYIMENFSYSHVGFRQSGYVPQKPAKTIQSKLGDCKDFSTLYVTLAQMAKLKSHLVLILTSDYGEKAMMLPSQDFNHCVAKVFIDGKPQYLELTDNDLPYRSVPNSLQNATALDIPNKLVSDVSTGIYKLENIAHDPTIIESHAEYVLGDNTHRMQLKSILKGSLNSYYGSIFKEKNPDVVKTSITESLQSRLTEDFTLDNIYDIEYDLRSSTIKYTCDLEINEKINEVGSMKVLSLPIVSRAYEKSIIIEDKRNFPIDYLLYENVDEYISNYILKIDKNEQFIEVPKSVSLKFKKHSFKIDYNLVRNNELRIKIHAIPSKERIAPEDYKEFKAYVKATIDAKKQLIGFKESGSKESK